TLTVRELAFAILGVSPNHGSNAGQATLTIQGAQLTPSGVVSLLGGDGSRRAATRVLFKDNTTLFATFDLTGLAPGGYDVQIQDNGHSDTSLGAFTVNSAPAANVTFSLTCSQYTHDNNPGSITIDYANTGNTDAPAPFMILSSDN